MFGLKKGQTVVVFHKGELIAVTVAQDQYDEYPLSRIHVTEPDGTTLYVSASSVVNCVANDYTLETLEKLYEKGAGKDAN